MKGRSYRFVLTRDAGEAGVAPLDIKMAAAEALGRNGITLRPEIQYLRFQAKGRHFALATRTIIEVDLMPHRTPDRTIRLDKPLKDEQ